MSMRECGYATNIQSSFLWLVRLVENSGISLNQAAEEGVS